MTWAVNAAQVIFYWRHIMKVYHSVDELIGSTPLLELGNYEKKHGLKAAIFAKLEYLNPAGSAKDRVAKSMLDDAEERGVIKPGATIIEPTSGNTGIGLCAVAAARGYNAVIVMPDSMSKERITLMKAYGAQVVLTPGALGMKGCIDKAEELKALTPGAFIPGQFVNPANPKAHFETTGPEIWRDTDGRCGYFCRLRGHRRHRNRHRQIPQENEPRKSKSVAVEPASSPLLSGGKAGPHKIQGIGANFVPEVLDSLRIRRGHDRNSDEAAYDTGSGDRPTGGRAGGHILRQLCPVGRRGACEAS
jgi:cysteine synthase A